MWKDGRALIGKEPWDVRYHLSFHDLRPHANLSGYATIMIYFNFGLGLSEKETRLPPFQHRGAVPAIYTILLNFKVFLFPLHTKHLLGAGGFQDRGMQPLRQERSNTAIAEFCKPCTNIAVVL
jgi:hypothetical protein